MMEQPGYEVRFHAYPPNILDLACGFMPRGIYMAQEGYHCVGADLPFVIDQVKPGVAALIDSREELV